MIDFNRPPYFSSELQFIKEAIERHQICGDGFYTAQCAQWICDRFKIDHAYLTTSCTHALEMAALLLDIQPGDEVIMPSYTFVSTANAFVLHGAKIVFVDIRPDTMNIDEKLVEDAITERTRAIVPVHYAGVGCEMDTLMEIARRHGLSVVEDAAQGVMAAYKGKSLGTIGDIGCYSFHETKNYSMGEGGALLVHQSEQAERAEIIRQKGTNRGKFLRGQVDKYTWVDCGSSYLPSDINAAFLWAQLLHADEINQDRLRIWRRYDERLRPLAEQGLIDQPVIPAQCSHNAHMYYIKVKDLAERTTLIEYLASQEIQAVFHYVPLHSSQAGIQYGRFHGEDCYTTRESERLLRLPLYFHLSEEDQDRVIAAVQRFFHV
ncbi:MAG: dTDP-4-amino-4,6-dideoxygalactose transaminase [Clostridiaceae bacterium]|nr:dTDP-4-amino-4,6-dideoxygalactose transaminase [Clostridiaceae bacterium]